MLIGAYGEFWDTYLVNWHPGSGSNSWRLLGKNGQYFPGLRVVDFRRARGVYVLYDHHGAYYAGLARGVNGIGGRLKDHMSDEHAGRWQRFSWYAFDSVSKGHDQTSGMHEVVRRDKPVPGDDAVIRELEALLITVLGTRGQRKMKFQAADSWEQVASFENDDLLNKVAGR